MSRKHRKQPRSFPWPLAAFGGILLLLAAVLFARNSSGAAANPDKAANDGGRIAVDQQKIDYGYVKYGNTKSFKIKVTNTGGNALRFAEQPYIEVLEGCWPPNLTVGSMVLQPGESTYVESGIFMMHPGMDGKHDFGVHLQTNDDSNRDLVVHVLSDWGP